MTKAEIITFLRTNCKVQDTLTSIDPLFLALTDTQMESYLTVAMSSEYPSGSIEDIPEDYVYPIILVAKRELYYQMSVNSAPLYPISAGEDGSLKKNIRFDHYFKLITGVEKDYKFYKETQIPVSSSEVTIAGRYYTNRNYNLATRPSITLLADTVADTYVNLSWTFNTLNRSKFYNCKIYQHTSSIVDLYDSDVPISEDAEEVEEIIDIQITQHRVTGLTPNTTYYFAIAVQEKNGLKGFSEVTFTTLL